MSPALPNSAAAAVRFPVTAPLLHPPTTADQSVPRAAVQRKARPSPWHRGRALKFLLAFSVVLGGCQKPPDSPPEPPPAVAPRPLPADRPQTPLRFPDCNLVFVSFDALQAAHVGALGNPRKVTPTLDSLAARGTLFRNAYSVASWTVPASMTWFTGVYPSEHRMTNKFAEYNATTQRGANLRELSPHLVTLAEILRAAGYATGGFTGNAGVSGGFGYDQGFDQYYYERGKFGGFEESVPRALEWLRSVRERKFFLFLHGYDCHGQRTPGPGYDYRYVDPNYDHRYLGSALEQELLREEGLEQGRLNLRDSDVQFWRGAYDEKVERADALFADFLGQFEQLGLLEKTLFVVTSDHGTELCEHNRLDHGFTLYDEQLHVPLIIRLPGQTEGRQISDRVSSIDLLPTILDLLQVEPQVATQPFRGQSLEPALRGEPLERVCFAETDYREYTYKRAILRPDGQKLILTLERQERELYDLTADPGETTNLAPHNAALADALEAELRAHFRSIGCDLESRTWKPGLNPVYPSQGKAGR